MTPPRRHRRLSEAEIALWRAVAETVEPRPGSQLPTVPTPPAPALAMPVEPPPAEAPRAKRVRQLPPLSYTPKIDAGRPPVPPLAPLERRFKQKVHRGHVDIERVFDLHGLTQAQAHQALRGFLRTAHFNDMRLVLVVTGKGQRGRPLDDFGDGGVLRRAVPHWLREPDLRAIVLGFEEAGSPHGGGGALYIRLRRRRGPG